MTISNPTNLTELLACMGAAGKRLNAIEAIEAGAGNLSAAFDWQVDLTELFPDSRTIELPWTVPGLFGYTVLVTGTGCRLREVGELIGIPLVDHVIVAERGCRSMAEWLATQ